MSSSLSLTASLTAAHAVPSFPTGRGLDGGWQPVCIARLHYHITWSTRAKAAVLTGKRVEALKGILAGLCQERGIHLQATAVTPSHVHLVVSLRPSQLAATAVRELKGRSALALLRQCPDLRVALGGHLVWNDRYALATVSPRQLARLTERIASHGL